MINATKDYAVPGISAQAYAFVYGVDEEGCVTLPDTKLFCTPREEVVFNDECEFYPRRHYNLIIEQRDEESVYQVYCADRGVFYGLINLTKEMFDQYFLPFNED